jgi:CheY-like chemotaxis protein
MKKILIVDDSEDMKYLYTDMFEDASDRYKIEIISNVSAALEKIKEEQFDLVILDMIMDPLPGDAFLLRAKSSSTQKIKTTPILIVSIISKINLEQLLKYDHVGYMEKPVTKERLFKKIDKMIE